MNDQAEVTIDLLTGDEEMTEKTVLQLISDAGAQGFQALMTDIGANASSAHNFARLGAVNKFNELGTVESRAHSGIIATPVAGPTNAQGGG